MSLANFLRLWPYRSVAAPAQVETIFEEAALRAGLVPVYVSPTVLGVGQLHQVDPTTGEPLPALQNSDTHEVHEILNELAPERSRVLRSQS